MFKEFSLLTLSEMLETAEIDNDQYMINAISFEIVTRIYVPFSEKSFDDLLLEYGYKPTRNKSLTK